MQKIDYEGTVWVLNNNNPQPLLDHTIHMLEKHGVKREDMEVNQGQTTLEEDVLEGMEDQTEVEIQEMTEEVEKDTTTKAVKIATVDVVDGKNCKT